MTHQKRIAAMIAEIEAMDGLTDAQEDAAHGAIEALVPFKMALEFSADTPIDDDPYKSFRGIAA